WIEGAFAQATPERTATWANVLLGAGIIGIMQDNDGVAHTQFEECITIASEFGANRIVVFAFLGLGLIALHQHNYVLARTEFEKGIALARQIGDKYGLG